MRQSVISATVSTELFLLRKAYLMKHLGAYNVTNAIFIDIMTTQVATWYNLLHIMCITVLI